MTILDYSLEVVWLSRGILETILSITWIPQSALNYLGIVYMFKRNIYYDVKIQINNEYEDELYTSLLDTDVSRK